MNSTTRTINHFHHHMADTFHTTLVDIVDNEDAPETRINAIINLHQLRMQMVQKMEKLHRTME
jgi:hypothetical protein